MGFYKVIDYSLCNRAGDRVQKLCIEIGLLVFVIFIALFAVLFIFLYIFVYILGIFFFFDGLVLNLYFHLCDSPIKNWDMVFINIYWVTFIRLVI